jgi:hypothetical protein
VTLVYHSMAVGALAEGGERIDGVELWSKQGRLDVRQGDDRCERRCGSRRHG